MTKLEEMTVRLIKEGMKADNLPVGFMDGAKLKTLKGIRMKCAKMTLFARMEGEQLVDFEKYLPYGFLHVEAPELRENTIVAVRHKLDFYNAWILEQKGLLDDEECEVHLTYRLAPGFKRIFGGFLPQFEYMVFSRGTFDFLCSPQFTEFALLQEPILRLYGHERQVNED